MPAQLRVRTLISQLRPLLAAIADYDAKIAELGQSIPDYRIFAAFTGASGAQPSSAKASSSGPDKPSRVPSGPVLSTPNNALAAYRIKPRYGHSHFKWIRILFRCWQDRTLYDESKCLKALQLRHSRFCAPLQFLPLSLDCPPQV